MDTKQKDKAKQARVAIKSMIEDVGGMFELDTAYYFYGDVYHDPVLEEFLGLYLRLLRMYRGGE